MVWGHLPALLPCLPSCPAAALLQRRACWGPDLPLSLAPSTPWPMAAGAEVHWAQLCEQTHRSGSGPGSGGRQGKGGVMREPHRLRSEITQSPRQTNLFHPAFLFFPDSAPGATSLQPRRRRRRGKSLLSFLPIVSTIRQAGRQAADCLSCPALDNTSIAPSPSQLSLPCTHANFARLQVLSRSRKSAARRKPNRGSWNMQNTQAAQFAAVGSESRLRLCCAAVKDIRCCKRVESGCQGGVHQGAAGSKKSKVGAGCS